MDAIKLTENDKIMFREMVEGLFPIKDGQEGNISVHEHILHGLMVSVEYDDGTNRIHWYEFMERFLIPELWRRVKSEYAGWNYVHGGKITKYKKKHLRGPMSITYKYFKDLSKFKERLTEGP